MINKYINQELSLKLIILFIIVVVCITYYASIISIIQTSDFPYLFQFTAWVDAVIFVFSLENESSFNAIYNYYTKMSHYRNTTEIPLILVGTQGEHTCYHYLLIPYFKYLYNVHQWHAQEGDPGFYIPLPRPMTTARTH